MFAAVLFSVLVQSFDPPKEVFSGTVSKSGRIAVIHSTKPDGKGGVIHVNQLVNQNSGHIAATLTGFNAPAQTGTGHIFAVYNADETMAIVVQPGTPVPRAISLVAIAAGKQLDLKPKLMGDAQYYLEKHPQVSASASMDFNVKGARFSGARISFSLVGQPSGNAATVYLQITYTYRVTSTGILVGNPAFNRLTDQTTWGWAK